MPKADYRTLDPLPAGVIVLRPSTLANGAALVECHHDPSNLVRRSGAKGMICGVCKQVDPARYVKLIAYVPDPNETQGALF